MGKRNLHISNRRRAKIPLQKQKKNFRCYIIADLHDSRIASGKKLSNSSLLWERLDLLHCIISESGAQDIFIPAVSAPGRPGWTDNAAMDFFYLLPRQCGAPLAVKAANGRLPHAFRVVRHSRHGYALIEKRRRTCYAGSPPLWAPEKDK